MSFYDTIKNVIGTAWHWIEDEAEDAWKLFQPVVTRFTTQELAQLKSLVGQVLPDIQKGDLEALEVAVINAAAGAGVAFLGEVQTEVLQPILATIAHNIGWA